MLSYFDVPKEHYPHHVASLHRLPLMLLMVLNTCHLGEVASVQGPSRKSDCTYRGTEVKEKKEWINGGTSLSPAETKFVKDRHPYISREPRHHKTRRRRLSEQPWVKLWSEDRLPMQLTWRKWWRRITRLHSMDYLPKTTSFVDRR